MTIWEVWFPARARPGNENLILGTANQSVPLFVQARKNRRIFELVRHFVLRSKNDREGTWNNSLYCLEIFPIHRSRIYHEESPGINTELILVCLQVFRVQNPREDHGDGSSSFHGVQILKKMFKKRSYIVTRVLVSADRRSRAGCANAERDSPTDTDIFIF